MKKSALSFLGLTALLTLAGCGATESVTHIPTDAKSVMNNVDSEMLFVGDTFQLSVTRLPLVAYDAKVAFASANENVVKVNSKGLVTATGLGIAKVTSYLEKDPTIKSETTFYVVESESKSSNNDKIKAITDYQKEHYFDGDEIVIPKLIMVENYEKILSQGKTAAEAATQSQVKEYYLAHETYRYSREDGYFDVGGWYEESNIVDGEVVDGVYKWGFWTKSNYASYLFHESSDVKNVMYVSTEYYIDQNTPRYEIVYKMLDSLFTSGREILTDTFEDCLQQDMADSFVSPTAKGILKRGKLGDNCTTATLSQSYTEKVDPRDEYGLGIPANTSCKNKEYYTVLWENNLVRQYNITAVMTYQVDGVYYHREMNIHRAYYYGDDANFDLPNNADYNAVDDLSDL